METQTIDLDAYLARIGYDGPRAPTLEGLAALQLAHVQAIAFENLDALLDRGVRLDLDSLQAKLVRGRRGGYCFEQNLLFRAALRALGFAATCLAARVYLDRPAEAPVPARTHLALRVVVDGRSHLVDVGFGGLTPTGPIPFAMGEARATPHEPFRLLPAGDERDLEACVGGTWKHLYRYGLDEPAEVDHLVANHYVATHPVSSFRHVLMAARVAPGARHTLIDDRLSFQTIDGEKRTERLPDAAAAAAALDRVFGVAVPDAAAFAAAFARVTRADRSGDASSPSSSA